jgi:hypothetical protein
MDFEGMKRGPGDKAPQLGDERPDFFGKMCNNKKDRGIHSQYYLNP